MIIMINGAFGVGKTTIANTLQNEIENSMIYDPEEIGYMLRNVIPIDIKRTESTTGDFQDLELWKELTVDVAKRLITKYKINLIVPMTIRKIEYFHFIYNGFKSIDDQTHHFCLSASKETIYERLRLRGEEEGNWCFQQTDKCLEAYNQYDFGEYIDTEKNSIIEIIQEIKEKLSLF
ncbi:AAA family ATPase [Rummeliibacillus stabekisii]|uniref:AAA family ATPase n=1 Tax=Rummeliibacillus stabekisii TaxID=241244 RepID=UPI00116B6634|nr:AAA family ATPase [Rummeliibacillus stabekisii]MBB5170845.1 deoxyadenosine/deoxycytidine kinase [Rummeliibacillus stabekisii]GEL05897.1 tunicamycin resistance protein [Rummeliibacillus stabekisii]